MMDPEGYHFGDEHRSSLWETPRRCTFSAGARDLQPGGCVTPPYTKRGPGDYETPITAFRPNGAVMGNPAKLPAKPPPPCDEATVARVEDPTGMAADPSLLKYSAAVRTVFGSEARSPHAVTNAEYLRSSPEAGHLRTSPGPVYDPDDRPARPRSAGPSWSMRGRRRGPDGAAEKFGPRPRSSGGTSSLVGPSTYHAGAGAMGPQLESRRKTARASSFGRASRFPTSKPAGGQMIDECKSIGSQFGAGPQCRRSSSATFGSATRDQQQRVRLCRRGTDYGLNAYICQPNIAVPNIAPRKEIIRFSRGAEGSM